MSAVITPLCQFEWTWGEPIYTEPPVPPWRWSSPPKWPPITTEMMPTTEMIPGISGMELRGLQKLDNNLVRAFYLFILHLFYGV